MAVVDIASGKVLSTPKDTSSTGAQKPQPQAVTCVALSPNGTLALSGPVCYTSKDSAARLWDVALQDYEDLIGLDFDWMALDGSLHKAPLGGEKNRAQPHGPRQRRRQAQPVDRGPGHPGGAGP